MLPVSCSGDRYGAERRAAVNTSVWAWLRPPCRRHSAFLPHNVHLHIIVLRRYKNEIGEQFWDCSKKLSDIDVITRGQSYQPRKIQLASNNAGKINKVVLIGNYGILAKRVG